VPVLHRYSFDFRLRCLGAVLAECQRGLRILVGCLRMPVICDPGLHVLNPADSTPRTNRKRLLRLFARLERPQWPFPNCRKQISSTYRRRVGRQVWVSEICRSGNLSWRDGLVAIFEGGHEDCQADSGCIRTLTLIVSSLGNIPGSMNRG
jgi:hypothetical protein